MTKLEKIQKVRSAVEDMAKRVEFQKNYKTHLYVDVQTGEWLQGVSTVSSIVPKDWLAAYGAKEAVRALGYSDYPKDTLKAEEMLDRIKRCENVQQYLTILKEAKSGHINKSKKALADGQEGHKWLEDFVKARIENQPVPSIPVGTPLERPLTQFMDWEAAHVDSWVISEARVCYPEKGYAGTLDAIAVLNGDASLLALIDFKFASHLGEDYYLQTAGYAATFEPYGITFDKRILLRLPKTPEQDKWNPQTFRYEKVPNNIEPHEVPTNYEVDREVFFACLPVKQWVNYVTKLSGNES